MQLWKTRLLVACVTLLMSPLIYGQGSPNVTLLANLNNYPGIEHTECWGYAAGGREYALLGIETGTSIIDVTDPTNPVEITFIPSAEIRLKDIKTYQTYAYVVTDGVANGIQIIDLSDLPNSAVQVGFYTELIASHNIFIDEAAGIMYAEGEIESIPNSKPIRVISLADPLNPVEIHGFGNTAEGGQNAHDFYAKDNLLYVAEGANQSVAFYDMTIPTAPVLLSRFVLPGGGFVHSAWPSDDGDFLMTTEETPGKTVKLWDITDLNNPILKGDYLATNQIAHNVHLRGNFAYISHYTDGLRIVNISDPLNIVEAGFYDTFPGGSLGAFDGAWGVYALLPSGNIIISDTATGLYLFSFQGPPDVSITSIPQNPPVIFPSGGGFLNFDVTVTNNTSSSWSGSYWNKVLMPFGEEVGPVAGLGPFAITVSPGGSFNASHSVEIPGGVPSATYGFNMKVGNFPNTVLDVASFNMTKTTGPTANKASGSTGFEDWLGIDSSLPDAFDLGQNYPNPFNPTTTISFQLPQAENVRIIIYDLTGREVRELLNENRPAGSYTINWNGRNKSDQTVATGLYIYQIHAGQFSQTQKMVFAK